MSQPGALCIFASKEDQGSYLYLLLYSRHQVALYPRKGNSFRWPLGGSSEEIQNSRVVGTTKLNFEEMSTVLMQIEAYLNSRPLGTLLHNDDDGIEMLTPGCFLIGRPLQAIPDHPKSYDPMPLLKRWYLCEALVRHFWERWSREYLIGLRSYSKWRCPERNLCVGDIVVLKEDNFVPLNGLLPESRKLLKEVMDWFMWSNPRRRMGCTPGLLPKLLSSTL